MNRTALTIQMLLLLKSRGLMKKQEIAEALEVNPRNIVEFKRELETAGYDIETRPGQHGGYLLRDAAFFPLANLTILQRESLVSAKDYLLASQHPLINKSFKEGYQLMIANETQPASLATKTAHRYTMSLQEIESHISKLTEAITQQKRVRLVYRRGLTNTKEHIFEPYHNFEVNQGFYTIGFIKYGDVSTFKINRIVKLEVLAETYVLDRHFNINQEIDDFGFRFDEAFNLHLRITGAPHYAEHLYGDQQKIKIINDQDFELFVQTRGKIATIRLVLEMGGNVQVISPAWLIDEVLKQHQQITKIYDLETLK